MLTAWALLLLATLGACSIVAVSRRRGMRWAGEVAAAALDSGRGALSSIGGRGRALRSVTGSPAVSRITVLPPLAGTTLDGSAPAEEITAPPDGWAPPFFTSSDAAPIEEITAPPDGWAAPFFARSEAAPIEEITAPPGGWAPPIQGLTAPIGNATRPVPTSRRRTVAQWRELRAYPPTTLRVAGGAIAAILAVAAKPQRARGRRHR